MYQFSIQALYKANDFRKGVKRVTCLSHLEKYLDETEKVFNESHANGMGRLNSLRLILPTPKGLTNPYSDAYRSYQMDLYKRISRNDEYHCRAAESSRITVEEALSDPYPYSTKDLVEIGKYFLAMGYMFSQIPWKAGSRIVEFGPGWGHTSLALARSGYQVTVVEIDPTMCERIRRLASQESLDIKVIEADMLSAAAEMAEAGFEFDGALFFESFHHCADHWKLIGNLRKILGKNGSIIFGAEPITYYPIPWGLRLDGQSLWAIRRYGWLELGFDKFYFKNMLKQHGFKFHSMRSSVTHAASVILAS